MQPKALKASSIKNVEWNENQIDSIIKLAASQTHQDKDTIYQSQTYCLNINYRFKNSKDKKFQTLHSGDKEDDKFERPFVQNFELVEKHNPFKNTKAATHNTNEPCLVPFSIW